MLSTSIAAICEKRIGRKPDLDNPRGYNDLIQWLKLFDQRSDHIICCDKWAVREWVAGKAGEVLIEAQLGITHDFLPCFAKCTHDSGSAIRVNSIEEADRATERLTARLCRPYGVEKGEWAYQFVPAQIISERPLPGPDIDFKFHCSHGKVRWVQLIWGRFKGRPREAIYSPEGRVTQLHMDDKMEHRPMQAIYPGDRAWFELTALAEKLAAGWRYVRVDLYWSRGKAWFGELTFWPRAGCYMTPDEPKFGEMLGLDLSYKLDPIVT